VTQLNSDPNDTLPTAHNYNGPQFGGPDPNGDGRPLWMNLVERAIGNNNTRLAITLDGVDGATTPEQALDSLVEQGRPLVGGPWADVNGNGTAWEMATLRLKVILGSRDWGTIDWYWRGSKVENMTPPPWAESD
jgi:hypothetical protein